MFDRFFDLDHLSPAVVETQIFELPKTEYVAVVSQTNAGVIIGTLARIDEAGFLRQIGSTSLYVNEKQALVAMRRFALAFRPLMEQVAAGDILDISAAKFVRLREQTSMNKDSETRNKYHDMFARRRWEATCERLGVVVPRQEAETSALVMPKRRSKFPIPKGADVRNILGS